jgi:bacillithiol biosynthesis deacetylase BshB1
MPEVDVMAFGAHPDDVELGCGGTLIKLTDAGLSVVVVDLVEGELATRGTIETRREEASAAAKILGVMARENLALEDGHIRASKTAKQHVVEVIRRYRPRMLLIPYHQDRHPDHCHASELVYEGAFLAGLARYETSQERHRPAQVAYYMGWYEFEPTFVVDITEQFDRKMAAVYAFSTQFKPDDKGYEQTRLTSPQHQKMLVHRMGYYGSLIGKDYGEGFLIRGQMEIEHPLEARFSSF